MNNVTLVSAALASLLALGAAQPSFAQDKDSKAAPAPKEKCFGIAKAGKNSCASASHACAGYAKEANLPDEWVFVARGTCVKAGGKLADGAKKSDAKKS